MQEVELRTAAFLIAVLVIWESTAANEYQRTSTRTSPDHLPTNNLFTCTFPTHSNTWHRMQILSANYKPSSDLLF